MTRIKKKEMVVEDSEEVKMYDLIQEESKDNNETKEVISLFPSIKKRRINNNNENNKNDYNDDDDDIDSSDPPSFDWSFSEEDYDNDTDDVFDVEGGMKGKKVDDVIFVSSLFQSYHEKDGRFVVMQGGEHEQNEENEENSSSTYSNHTNHNNINYDPMDEDSFKSIQ